MNFIKIIFGFALMVFCYISIGHSHKCYVCGDKKTCSKPQLYDCSPALANATRLYINQYHSGNISNIVTNKYDCFKEYLITNTSELYYKGCAYANTHLCGFPLKPQIAAMTKKTICSVCPKDKCNPADRAGIDMRTIFATIAVAIGLRCVWN